MAELSASTPRGARLLRKGGTNQKIVGRLMGHEKTSDAGSNSEVVEMVQSVERTPERERRASSVGGTPSPLQDLKVGHSSPSLSVVAQKNDNASPSQNGGCSLGSGSVPGSHPSRTDTGLPVEQTASSSASLFGGAQLDIAEEKFI